ncbi:hypothetical protein EMIHUDRAFT_100175 [Emiliania huxleyi CCMP1516]|uniref:AMP-dependent synthetase/ligase domain-containing protein n=2 Tax=Emiliania huxleyi TaxID=2903 RepID=A0A0D3JWC5_EMIH1|nr:hypothetical protein EMIHUDRAFT_100175 [Emiliania huxleyi CCMP1516]EOD27810.1 hypothetical protein EMIHUDRAFT_100175 [Emiliania huxleyi CCMP1516]|eukprot:XP_005780239.1 hypothetical protein EMIHUDRAFT_100175 [Emiliania huxleyi CCMP1516]
MSTVEPSYTTKADLRGTPWREALGVPESEIVRFHTSSGSSGTPTVTAYTKGDLKTLGRLTARTLLGLLPLKLPLWRCYNAFGYGLFTGGLSFEAAAAHARTLDGLPPVCVIPTSNLSGSASLEAAVDEHARLLRLFEPNVLFGTPSLAYVLWEKGLLGSFKAIITGGEPSSSALRELLRGCGQRTVIEAYGLSEVLGPGVAQSSSERDELFLNEDAFECEVLDEGGDGVGELVISTRLHEATPRRRYRTGDAVRVVKGGGSNDVKCDRPGRAVTVLGRLSSDFSSTCGVYLSEIEEVLVSHGYSPCFELADEERSLAVEALRPPAGESAPPLLQLPEWLTTAVQVSVVEAGSMRRSLGKSCRRR